MTNRDINKLIVLEFYKDVIGNKNSDCAKRMVTNDYIQHNPLIKTGKAGLLEAVEMLKQIPTPKNVQKPLMRLIAEDNLVMVHLNVEFAGERKIVLDLFRIEDGLIAEHWDAIEDVTNLGSEALSAIEGPLVAEDHSLTTQNRGIIETFCQRLLIERHFEELPNYVSQNLIQHTPTISDGLTDFGNSLHSLHIEQVHKIIVEGNFVVTQSTGVKAGMSHVFYDIYRLKNSKIQEHWSVYQMIPEIMAHENGMI